MTLCKLQSKFGLKSGVTGSFGKQRRIRNFHQKAVTKFERKTFLTVDKVKVIYGGYKS